MRRALSHRTLSRCPLVARRTIVSRIATIEPHIDCRARIVPFAPRIALAITTHDTLAGSPSPVGASSIAPRIEHPGLSRPRCRTIFCRTICWECWLCAAYLGLVVGIVV